MTKVFAVQGAGQRGAALADLPWLKCRELFDLDDMSRTEDRPKFGEGDQAAIFATRVVIQLEEDEARQHGVQAGFFVSPLTVERAKAKLNDLP